MEKTEQTASEIKKLVSLFLPLCNDRETLLALHSMVEDQNLWHEGHSLFQNIRFKTLGSEKSGNRLNNIQYCFEEACAKTLYNLSGSSAPFDADSADWIHPNALALAKALNISDPESAVAFGPN